MKSLIPVGTQASVYVHVKFTHPSVVHNGHSLCKHTCLSLYRMIDEFIYAGRSSFLPNCLQHLLNITALRLFSGRWMLLFDGFISRCCRFLTCRSDGTKTLSTVNKLASPNDLMRQKYCVLKKRQNVIC